MAIETTVVGSYPKPPDEGQTFTVRKTLHALERGDASVDDLKRAQDDLVTQVIKEQESAGIDLVSDGHGRWDDILTPIARQSAGFEIGGLLRWFDNNVYYRRPVCTGPIEWRGPSTVDAFRFAQSVATHDVKAIVPGPVTFARLSVDEYYGTHEEFVLAIARLLAQEVFELEAAGCKHIQIDEPALVDAPEDIDLGSEALYLLTNELDEAETTLATYFGDIKRLGPQLFEYPVNFFALDFVSGPENFQIVEQLPSEKKLQAGILDARNTKLETVEELERTIDMLAAKVTEGRLRVAPSAGLEFLPREKARAKLERLGEAAKSKGGA
jgi:5-methyltetrahydropteroyltriglutamate--homocysteine methyltransferase